MYELIVHVTALFFYTRASLMASALPKRKLLGICSFSKDLKRWECFTF